MTNGLDCGEAWGSGGVRDMFTTPQRDARTSLSSALKRRSDITSIDARPWFPGVMALGPGPDVQLWTHRHGTDCDVLRLAPAEGLVCGLARHRRTGADTAGPKRPPNTPELPPAMDLCSPVLSGDSVMERDFDLQQSKPAAEDINGQADLNTPAWRQWHG